MTAGGVLLELEAVSKAYSRGRLMVPALQEVSLSVRSGEFVSVVGPSGSGKTTLLQLIAGLERPDSGRVVVRGQNLATLGEGALADYRSRSVGFVFQAANLLPTLSALENVALPLLIVGMPREMALARAEASLTRLELSHRLRYSPPELSGGEAQRVAVARALVHEPPLLLADEPTSSLDALAREALLNLFVTLAQGGQTVMMVTHDARAAAHADRMVRLKYGRVQDISS